MMMLSVLSQVCFSLFIIFNSSLLTPHSSLIAKRSRAYEVLAG